MIYATLALSVLAVTTASRRPGAPDCSGTFCASVLENLVVNGETQSSSTYGLCMDTKNLNWKRTEDHGKITILNTPLNLIYTILPDGSCTQTAPTEPATPNDTPFSFVNIDSEAYLSDVHAETPDTDVATQQYYHDREGQTGSVTVPEEEMYWYTAKVGTDFMMGCSSCKQMYDVSPGDGGNSTTQFGNRDFTKNYDVAAGEAVDAYTLPAGVTCLDSDAVHKSADVWSTAHGF